MLTQELLNQNVWNMTQATVYLDSSMSDSDTQPEFRHSSIVQGLDGGEENCW